jgi:hypothetical protein
MGLDISHGTWHGAYGAFHNWRRKIAKVLGLPPLDLMDGFYNPLSNKGIGALPTLYHPLNYGEEYSHSLKRLDENLPIRWEILKEDPIYELLYHSDCDGILEVEKLPAIRDRLIAIKELLPDEEVSGHIGSWKIKTQTFIDGLNEAIKAGENIEFH